MMIDREQVQALASRAQFYSERALVYRIQAIPLEDQVKRAALLAGLVWALRGDCAPRVVADTQSPGMARIQLPEDGNVNIYMPSGAIDAFTTSAASRPPLADDESALTEPKFVRACARSQKSLTKHFMTDGEELRPERLWETKARGETMTGQSSADRLLEVVGSLRRYLHGLPVLGRASVHVALGGENEVTKWGVDWRSRDGDAFTETETVDPDEGARRVLAELRNRQPESRKPPDLEPEQMTFGYFRCHDDMTSGCCNLRGSRVSSKEAGQRWTWWSQFRLADRFRTARLSWASVKVLNCCRSVLTESARGLNPGSCIDLN